MSKHQQKKGRPSSPPARKSGAGKWLLLLGALVIAGTVTAMVLHNSKVKQGQVVATPSNPSATAVANTNIPTFEINQAVMVTQDLEYSGKLPSVAEALLDVERRHQPDDGRGRVFSILEAFGEPSPDDNRKLRISMHVSTEKTGVGTLIFKPTGRVLWQNRVVLPTNAPAPPFSGKNLAIYLDDGAGKLLTVDGSSNPSSILEARVKEIGVPVLAMWPDGAEREMTFIYSACGCPVHVMTKRVGDHTMRTKELPVMFPDDPAVVTLIGRLMGW